MADDPNTDVATPALKETQTTSQQVEQKVSANLEVEEKIEVKPQPGQERSQSKSQQPAPQKSPTSQPQPASQKPGSPQSLADRLNANDQAFLKSIGVKPPVRTTADIQPAKREALGAQKTDANRSGDAYIAEPQDAIEKPAAMPGATVKPTGKLPEGNSNFQQPEEEPVAPEDEQEQEPEEEAEPDLRQQIASQVAEKNKLDKEISLVTKEASAAMNTYLLGLAESAWAAALPTFGFTILLGAVVGDFLWAFKNKLITKFLSPLLKTESLKGKAEEIARQIKISTAVKLNIIAMNLVVLLLAGIVSALLFTLLYVGCNSGPAGETIAEVTDYKLSYIGMVGGGDLCKAINDAAKGMGVTAGAGSQAVVTGVSVGGTCQAAVSGVASVANLSTTCFGSNADKASAIAVAESGGDPTKPSGVDKCADGNSVSWGLFQINLTNHKIAGLNCSAAFSRQYTAQDHSCVVTDQSLYSQCVLAAQNPSSNIQEACRISSNGSSWTQWGANLKCKY